MTTWRQQVRALDQLDAAGLLGDVLNHLHRLVARDEQLQADLQLRWWVQAMGDVDGLGERMAQVKGHGGYPGARLAFARDQDHRRPALRHLQGAIAAGDQRAYRRWRWTARAYARALWDFVAELAALERLEGGVADVEAAAGSEHVRQRRVLDALYTGYASTWRPLTRSTFVRLHALDRADGLHSLVAAYDAERQRMIQERSTLLERLQTFGAAAADVMEGAPRTLAGQVRHLDAAVRRLQHARDAEAAKHAVRDVFDRLLQDLGRSDSPRQREFLSTLLDQLKPPQQREPGTVP